MTRLQSYDPRADMRPRQRQIPDAIHRFVADELVAPAQIPAQNFGVVEHNRVVERRALYKPLCSKRLHFMNEPECPRSRQLAREGFLRHCKLARLPADQRMRKLYRYVQ